MARRTDLDALRILICAAVIVAHAALIFAEEPRYHLKSAVPSLSATVFYEFMRISTMAAFFVIAGWSAVVSLRRRSAGYFAMERIARILVPLAFGTLVFGAAIKYIELRHGRHLGLHGVVPHTPIDMHFFEFAYLYVKRSSLVTWSHLWFLGYLLVISLLLLPLLLWLARGKPRSELPGIPIVYVPRGCARGTARWLRRLLAVPSIAHQRLDQLCLLRPVLAIVELEWRPGQVLKRACRRKRPACWC